MVGKHNYQWNFDYNGLLDNVNNAKANHIGAWNSHYGLWGGRSMFAFPDYSRWVHIGTNTLPMMKTCIKNQGYCKDIYSLNSDESPNNHWIYENSELASYAAMRMSEFFHLYDGVHVLLSDRTGLRNEFIPDRIKTRADDDFTYTGYIPAHHHHNWRFRATE